MGDTYSKFAFNASRLILLISVSLFYGIIARSQDLAPVPQIRWGAGQILTVLGMAPDALQTDPVSTVDAAPVELLLPGHEQDGLIALIFDAAPRETNVRIIDRQGRVIHEWAPRWDEVWPGSDDQFLERPFAKSMLHGLVMLPDGSFISNFERYSTFRMDICGNVVWKLANYGHHSVSFGNNGTIWVPAEEPILTGPTGFAAHTAPLESYLLQEIDLDGNIIQSINVIDTLFKNNLEGLLLMRLASSGISTVSGDTLHLNDIDVFPNDIESDLFEPGDLLISLRDIHTLLILDPATKKVKWRITGATVRQHDADFLPSGRISVYDNQAHLASQNASPRISRIVEIDPRTNTMIERIGADSARTFFSRITGAHEYLENGNVLVVASQGGRLLEYTPDGELVWRYDARQDQMTNGRTYNALVLPANMDKLFFENAKRRCAS